MKIYKNTRKYLNFTCKLWRTWRTKFFLWSQLLSVFFCRYVAWSQLKWRKKKATAKHEIHKHKKLKKSKKILFAHLFNIIRFWIESWGSWGNVWGAGGKSAELVWTLMAFLLPIWIWRVWVFFGFFVDWGLVWLD